MPANKMKLEFFGWFIWCVAPACIGDLCMCIVSTYDISENLKLFILDFLCSVSVCVATATVFPIGVPTMLSIHFGCSGVEALNPYTAVQC